MCGICGIISKGPVVQDSVFKMNSSMFHRGPNGDGTYFEPNLGLAMRRLSIIDLEGGWQPIYNEDASLVLFMNGEIYNYIELRRNLEIKGHIFSTRSDCEVILHLYEDYGTHCISFLRGMFAIALWDKNKRQLMIARDRMGEKPLYIFQDQKNIIFASELRTILSCGLIEKSLNPKAIDLFFRYQYIPEPYTIIDRVKKLPPATFLLIDENLKIEETCYWKMEEALPLQGNSSDLIREQLDEIGQLIIRSDVPVGVALSGGVDSSLVAALASRQYGNQMHAFTVGYEGRPASDERNVAKKIAEYLNLTFHEIELSNNDFIRSFPEICGLCDDPIADISAFGYYSVSKAAKEHDVPVLLQGQGGDELAWGYDWVRKCFILGELKKRILSKDRKAILELFALVMKERMRYPRLRRNWKDLLGIFYSFNQLSDFYKNPQSIPFYDTLEDFNADYTNLYGALLEDMGRNQYSFGNNSTNIPEIDLTQYICKTYLLENGIAQGDRLSMANSVELRLPLVDYRLVETIIGLRKGHSDIYDSPKAMLKNIAKEMLPDWLFSIPKRGFTPPVHLWAKSVLSVYGDRLIDDNLKTYGIMNANGLERLRKGQKRPSINFPLYFNALVLELYLDSIYN